MQYIDDLSVLDVVYISGLLSDYDFHSHVASDIGIGQRFLKPELTQTYYNNQSLALWTTANKAKLNEKKSATTKKAD